MAEFNREELFKILKEHNDWVVHEKHLRGETLVKTYFCVINNVEVALDDNTGDLVVDKVHVELNKEEYRNMMEHFRNCENMIRKKTLDNAFTKLISDEN